MDGIVVGLWIAGLFGFGLAVTTQLLGPLRQDRSTEQFGLALVLGVGGTSMVLFFWSLAGGPLDRATSLGIASLGLASGVRAWWICRPWFASQPATAPPVSTAFPLVARLVIFLLTTTALIESLLTPQRFWDERAYYALKAAVLFEDRTVRSADLQEPDYVQGHPRYPLLVPLAEHHLYALLGRVDDRLAKILFPVLYCGMVVTFLGVLTRRFGAGPGSLAGILLATVPVLMPDDYGFLCGQADAPVACFEGLAILFLWDWLSRCGRTAAEADSSLWIAATCAGLAAFTKDEGLAQTAVHSAAFAMVVIAGLIRRRSAWPAWRSGLWSVTLLLLMQAILIGPWLWHRRTLPMTGEMNYAGRLSAEALWNGLATLSWSIPHLGQRMFVEAPRWGLQWWLAVIAAILFPRRLLHRENVFLILVLMGSLTALLVAGMLAPVTLEEHIDGSSHRYLMQLALPVVLLGTSLLFCRTTDPDSPSESA